MGQSSSKHFIKKVTLAGEVARRYFNTSPCLVETDIMEEVIDQFRHKMMISGYSYKERELKVNYRQNFYFFYTFLMIRTNAGINFLRV